MIGVFHSHPTYKAMPITSDESRDDNDALPVGGKDCPFIAGAPSPENTKYITAVTPEVTFHAAKVDVIGPPVVDLIFFMTSSSKRSE